MLFEKKIHRFAGWLGLGAAALGGTMLAGWWLGREPLAAFSWEGAPIRADTAACQVLIGVNLWLITRRAGRPAVLLGATAALALCIGHLVGQRFGWDLGLNPGPADAGARPTDDHLNTSR
jgi:hypothetical protein